MNDIILFRSQDGKAEVQLRVDGETVWLSQAEIAELFDNKPQVVTMLIKAIYEEGEQAPGATCKESLQVRQEGELPLDSVVKESLTVQKEGSREAAKARRGEGMDYGLEENGYVALC